MPDIRTAEGRAAWESFAARPDRLLACFDFDGTLSPIVSDPAEAGIAPAARDALAALAPRIGAVAIVTGRPVDQVLDLGGFVGVGGLENLVILGQYGAERWDAATGDVVRPDPPSGLAAASEELPAVLREHGAGEAHVEDKRLALGVHVRRLPDAPAAFERLAEPLRDLAERHGLHAEPGKYVIELRAAGVDKGGAVRTLIAETDASDVLFAGDDLGDLAGFAAVRAHRDSGAGHGLLVASDTGEPTALAEEADLVVAGPDGVTAVITDLVTAIDS